MAHTIADLEVLVGADTSKAEQGLDNVNTKVDDLANNPNFDKASVGLMGIGTAGILGFGKSVFAAMDFETSLVDLGIATNTTGDDLDDLKMKVLDLGAAFPYSAGEVADLMTELAKIGFVGDDLDLVTESTMNLATALGTELLPTGEAINAVLKSFNMSAENASEIADQMYRILAAGSLDLDTLMNAWQYLGGVVDLAGLSFVEAGAFLSILTDRAIPAERAGRALKKMFTELINPSEDLKEMLGSLGISFADAEGNMLSVKDIIFNIIDAWQDLTSQEQIDLATMLVGTEFMDVAIALFDSGREAWDRFMEGYEGAISIVDAVKMKMASAKQIWETFKETIENISIVVGEQLLPAFNEAIGVATNLGDKIVGLPSGLLKIVAVVGTLGSGFMFLSGFLGIASKNIGVVTTGLRILGSAVTGPLGAIMLLATAFVLAYQNSETFRNIVHSVIDVLGDMFNRVSEIVSVFTSFVQTNETARTALEAVGVAVGVVAAAFVAFQVVQGVTTIINAMRVAMLGLNASFLANPVVLIVAAIAALAAGVYFAYQRFEPFRKIVDKVFDGLKKLGSIIGGAVMKGFNALRSVLSPIISSIGTLVGSGLSRLVSLFQTLAPIVGGSIVSGFNTLVSVATALWGAFRNIVDGGVASSFEVIRDAVESIIQPFLTLKDAITAAFSGDWSAAWDGMKQAAGEAVTAMFTVITAYPKTIIAFFQGVNWGALWDGIRNSVFSINWGSIGSAILSAAQSMIGGLRVVAELAIELIGKLLDGLGGMASSFWGWVTTQAAALAGWVVGLLGGDPEDQERAANIVTKIMGSIGDSISGGFSSAWDWIKSKFTGTSSWVASLIDADPSDLSRSTSIITKIGGGIIKGMWDGFSTIWDWIKGKFSNISGVLTTLINGDPDDLARTANIITNIAGSLIGMAQESWNSAWDWIADNSPQWLKDLINGVLPDKEVDTKLKVKTEGEWVDENGIDHSPVNTSETGNFAGSNNLMSPSGGMGGTSGGGWFASLTEGANQARQALENFNRSQITTGTQSVTSFGQLDQSARPALVGVDSHVNQTSNSMRGIWSTSLGQMAASAMSNFTIINSYAANNTNLARGAVASNSAAMASSMGSQLAAMAATSQTQMQASYGSVNSQMTAMNNATSLQTMAMAAVTRVQMALMAATSATQMNAMASNVQTGSVQASGHLSGQTARWASIILSAGASAASTARSAGYNIGAGIAAGLNSALGTVTAAANRIVSEVDRAIRAKARIASPAKMFMYHGEMIGEGFALGIQSTIGDVSKVGEELTNAAVHPANIGVSNGNGYTSRASPNSGGYVVNNPTYNVNINVKDLEEYRSVNEFFRDLEPERALA